MSENNPRILVVDDEAVILSGLKALLEAEGFTDVTTEQDPARALHLVQDEEHDLVLLDLNMPGVHGMEILGALVEAQPGAASIVLTADAEVDTAVRAMQLGASDFLAKPIDRARIVVAVRKALQLTPRVRNGIRGHDVEHGEAFGEIVTGSPKMVAIFRYLEKVAPTEITVVMTGASGSGKELLARALHRLSLRRDGPFLGVNVAAIPPTLFATHLFGHVAGAFTGARSAMSGYFEQTPDGTLFLDEIGDLDLQSQSQLLRALQEREFFKIGDTRPRALTSRLVVATNRDLDREVAEGRFRADLFYRLKASTIRVPSLVERTEDVPLLVNHFVAQFAKEFGKAVRRVGPRTLELLSQCPFPGNVRELMNVVREAVILEETDELRPTSLPEEYRRHRTGPPTVGPSKTLAELEKEHVLRVLQSMGGNVTRASQALGISRATLTRKLKVYRER